MYTCADVLPALFFHPNYDVKDSQVREVKSPSLVSGKAEVANSSSAHKALPEGPIVIGTLETESRGHDGVVDGDQTAALPSQQLAGLGATHPSEGNQLVP